MNFASKLYYFFLFSNMIVESLIELYGAIVTCMYVTIVKLLEPHPSVVATKLLERRKIVDCGKQFNMIACSWLQFMIHDWIDHMEDTHQV